MLLVYTQTLFCITVVDFKQGFSFFVINHSSNYTNRTHFFQHQSLKNYNLYDYNFDFGSINEKVRSTVSPSMSLRERASLLVCVFLKYE